MSDGDKQMPEQTPPAAPPIRRPGRPPKQVVDAVAEALKGAAPAAAEARIIEVRCDIPPDLPGIGATTTLSVTDPPCKAKGVRFDLHKVGVLISYADGSFFGVIPYAHVKRIRYDSDPR